MLCMDRGRNALIGELVHPGGLLGVLDGQADDAPVGVQVKVDVFVEFARFDRRAGGEFDQRRIGVGKVFDAHSSLYTLLGQPSPFSQIRGHITYFPMIENPKGLSFFAP